MRVVFLGTGGGRFVIINQLRATGGIILELDGQMMHIDPGPGALVRAKEYGVDLTKLTAVVVSHCHPDHCTDAEVVIEAMTHGATKSGGVFIGNGHAVSGGGDYRPAVSPYHLKAVGRHHAMKAGDKVKVGSVEITATPTFHDEPGAIGFVFGGSKTIGYTSDTAYFSGLEEHFKGCDYLIINVLRPRGKPWPKHMDTDQAAKLVEKARPGAAILSHFGMEMLKSNPYKEAMYIEDKTGVKTVAAKDGMIVELDGEKKGKRGSGGLGKWIK
jgi:phosphoribosyl 1,2-cyclic phosphodiesterase